MGNQSGAPLWIKLAGLCVIAVISFGLAAAALFAPQPAATFVRPPSSSTPAPTDTSNPVRVAAVGDSVTEGNSNDFSEGDIGDLSWVHWLGDGYTFAGGWADSGAPTSSMADSVTAYDADVLVIVAGTNDAGNGVPFEETTTNLDTIVDKSGIDEVVVTSIPPHDDLPGVSEEFNDELRQLAADRGWVFADAYPKIAAAGRYLDGFTADGVHPTVPASQKIAEAIREALATV
jgi:lysophospholipase L1-like esterase